MMLHVQLDQFEGPLGLLLYLIRKEEMDIYNIPIQRITGQYLEHLKHIKEVDIEAAGDFVAMAATLIQIKARMLLPNYNEAGEEVEVEDPRKELVQRLMEYQKFQALSKDLDKLTILNRDVFPRGMTDASLFGEAAPEDRRDDVELDEGGMFRMIQLYKMMLKKFSQRVHTVVQRSQSIAARILEIRHLFIAGQRNSFFDVLDQAERTKQRVLITFLSVLEMTRLGFLRIFQSEPYANIHLDCLKEISNDIVNRVDEFETRPVPASSGLLEVAAELDVNNKSEKPGVPQSTQLGFDLALAEQAAADGIVADENVAAEPVELVEAEGLETVVVAARAEDEAIPEEIATDDDLLLAEQELGFVAPAKDIEATVSLAEIVDEHNLEAEPVMEAEPAVVESTNAISEKPKQEFEPEGWL